MERQSTEMGIALHGRRFRNLVAAIALAACGGTTTRLTVSSVSPAPGSIRNQASTAVLQATFSKPVDCTRVTDNTLQVFELGLRVAGHVTCNGASIRFNPFQSLPTDTGLEALIEPTVTDLSGKPLGAGYSWSFAMAPWTRQMGTPTTDWAQGVATDAAGNVYVVGWTGGSLDGNMNTPGGFLVVKYNATGANQWTRQMSAGFAQGVATDAAGNVYVAGWTASGVDGSVNIGTYDMVVVKFDATGAKQWTRQIGTPPTGVVRAQGVATDAAGNFYVAGYTYGDLDGNVNAGLADLFVMKYDATGAKLWTRQMGTPAEDRALGVATDAAGNVYVAGHTYGGLDGNTNAGSSDLFVVKYDATGAKQWTRQMGTPTEDFARGVAADAAGNVYVAGFTTGGLDGNLHAGQSDLFVVKYDATGAKQWTRQMGTPTVDEAYCVATDAAGNVYVAGSTYGGLDGNVNTGGYDLFVVKYDAMGAKQWTRQMGTAGDHNTNVAFAQGVATDAAGNVYVAGATNGGLDGSMNAGDYDLFVVKYQQDGRKR